MTHCFVIARSMAVQNAAQPHLPVQHGDVGQPQQSPIQVPLRDRFNVRSPDTWASWVRRFNMTQADSTVPTTPTTPPLTIADNGPTPDVTPATATPNPDQIHDATRNVATTPARSPMPLVRRFPESLASSLTLLRLLWTLAYIQLCRGLFVTRLS